MQGAICSYCDQPWFSSLHPEPAAAPIAPTAEKLIQELRLTVEMAQSFFYSPTSFHVPSIEKRYNQTLALAKKYEGKKS
jgi:hypothetical protein